MGLQLDFARGVAHRADRDLGQISRPADGIFELGHRDAVIVAMKADSRITQLNIHIVAISRAATLLGALSP